MRLGKIFGIILVVLAVGFFLASDHRSPEELFAVLVLNPVPESVKQLRSEGSLNAFGSSSLRLVFEIAPSDFDRIIASEKFSKFAKYDVNEPLGRRPELYKQVANEAKAYGLVPHMIYIFEEPNSVYRFDALVTNADRTMALYRAF